MNLQSYLRKLRQRIFEVDEMKAEIIKRRIMRTKKRLGIKEGTINKEAYFRVMGL